MSNKFTLIELIVSMVVIAILAAIVTPNIKDFRKESIVTAMKADTKAIELAVDKYALDKNEQLPIETFDGPVLFGSPKKVSLKMLGVEYLKSSTKNKDGHWYLDESGSVYGSFVDIPTVDSSNNTISFERQKKLKSVRIFSHEDGKKVSLFKEFDISEVSNGDKVEIDFSKIENLPSSIVLSLVDVLGFETAYFNQKELESMTLTKKKVFDFGLMPSRILMERTSIADLGEIVSIKTNSGKASYIPLTQSDFYISASNGDIVKSEVVSGEYRPIDTKIVNMQPSSNYDVDGYRGTLTQYDVLPAATKRVENVQVDYYAQFDLQCIRGVWEESGYNTSSNSTYQYVDGELFKGRLSLVKSEPVDFDIVQSQRNNDPNLKYATYSNGIEVDMLDDCLSEKYKAEWEGKYQDYVYEESSNLSYLEYMEKVATGEILATIIARSEHSNVVSLVRTFEGEVSRVETPVYSGEVTRPDSDTRIYEDYYNYIIEVEYIPKK